MLSCLVAVPLLMLACQENKPQVFKNKHEDHDHDHQHERDKMMLRDVGPYHVGLTAHLSRKEGNELDVIFETQDKEPRPAPLPEKTLTARATREGESESHELVFEPAPPEERKGDPEGKCSHYSAKAPWMKPEDKLTITLRVPLDGQEKKVVFVDFNPRKFAHVDE
jgi:hypothetical protein